METFAQLFQIRSQTLRKPCLGSKGARIMSLQIAPSWGGPAQGHLLLPPPRTLCGCHWKWGALDTPHIPHPTQREWEGKQLVQTEGASGLLLLSWAHPAWKTDSMTRNGKWESVRGSRVETGQEGHSHLQTPGTLWLGRATGWPAVSTAE